MNNSIASAKYEKLKKLKEVLLAVKNTLEVVEILESLKKRAPSNRSRNGDDFYTKHFFKIKAEQPEEFFKYTRMTAAAFDILLKLITPRLERNSMAVPVAPECRLAVLLFYLSQGVSVQDLAYTFNLRKETTRCIILQTAQVLWEALSPAYVARPTRECFQQIATDFWCLWGMPNCVGAIDAKHIAVRRPAKNDSVCSNYADDFSIVLLAASDAKCRFTYIDVGAYGAKTDKGIFQASEFGKVLISNSLPMPPPQNLPGTELKSPHYFIADTAFPLAINLMRPFPLNDALSMDKYNFNKRLSKARRAVKNAFGLLIARWRILQTTMQMLPENAEKVVLGCVALHNYIMQDAASAQGYYCPSGFIDWEDDGGNWHGGGWRAQVSVDVPSIRAATTSNHFGGQHSIQARNNLCDFLAYN